MNPRLLCLLAALSFTTFAQAQTADPKPLVEKALAAVGGKDKLLKVFRFKEIFHFGNTPEPAAGKKRSTRESIFSQPDVGGSAKRNAVPNRPRTTCVRGRSTCWSMKSQYSGSFPTSPIRGKRSSASASAAA